MFDLNLIRHDRAAVEEMLARRETTAPLDEIVALDNRRAELAGRITALGEERNRLSQQIGRTPPAAREALVARVRALRDELRAAEEESTGVEGQIRDLLTTVPNLLAPDVPSGADDS